MGSTRVAGVAVRAAHRLLRLRSLGTEMILVGSIVGACSLLGLDRVETRIAPPGELPPPYDFAGIRDALGGRGTILSVPTADEIAQAGTSSAAFLRDLAGVVAESYPGEGARVVSVHVAVVDSDDSRFPIEHRLSYVVETTGHETGNCITIFDANTEQPYMAACFFSARSSP